MKFSFTTKIYHKNSLFKKFLLTSFSTFFFENYKFCLNMYIFEYFTALALIFAAIEFENMKCSEDRKS